ncbi:hypothetical protein HPB49_021491 [Dermacentor silvarum]|uniref:Uncharacterized protein n=1 Tax=Dermacentor silvarum TaxID=543639 RepID=A0ACB8CML5_DERSI|nr:hypothetical protein HPB49_021491 [Dermacentor silvarum]
MASFDPAGLLVALSDSDSSHSSSSESSSSSDEDESYVLYEILFNEMFAEPPHKRPKIVGYVEEDANRVVGSIIGGVFSGRISLPREGEEFYVERAGHFFQDSAPFHSLIYSARDVRFADGRCGLHGATKDAMDRIRRQYGGSNLRERSERRTFSACVTSRSPWTTRLFEAVASWQGSEHDRILRVRQELTSMVSKHVKAVSEIFGGTNFNGITGIEFVVQRLVLGCVPSHVAVMPDGNRRFAQRTGTDLRRTYIAGTLLFSGACRWCFEAGVSRVTVFVFALRHMRRCTFEKTALLLATVDTWADSLRTLDVTAELLDAYIAHTECPDVDMLMLCAGPRFSDFMDSRRAVPFLAPFMVGLGSFWIAVATLPCMASIVHSARTLNDFVLHYEPLAYEPISVGSRRWKRSAAQHRATRSVELAFRSYKSRVVGSIIGGVFSGRISLPREGEEFYVERAGHFFQDSAPFHSLIYSARDVRFADGRCGLHGATKDAMDRIRRQYGRQQSQVP